MDENHRKYHAGKYGDSKPERVKPVGGNYFMPAKDRQEMRDLQIKQEVEGLTPEEAQRLKELQSK